jgi:hypothetical protein
MGGHSLLNAPGKGSTVEFASGGGIGAVSLGKITNMKQTIFKLVFSGLLLAGTAGFASAQTTREFFDKKGRLQYTIAYYGEKELPVAVRSIIKPVYYDYTILTVEELRVEGRSIYFVDMQDANHIKTVQVSDGEMAEVRTLDRGVLPSKPQHSL